MKTIFDITEFGAVGDGVTICTEAIQKALDAAAACRGAVTVPPGTYLTGELHMGAGVSLEGHSAWSFRNYGASVFRLCDENAKCLLDITGAFGACVRGMSLDGANLGKNIHGAYLYWERYNGGGEEDTPSFDDCRIGNFTGNGVHLEHIWCFSVRHCMLHSNRGCGLYIDGWDGFILDNWFTGNRNCGILGGETVSSITVTGNRVEWNRLAGFYMPNVNCCNFTGNYFDRSGGPALALGADDGRATALSITGNLFYRSGKPKPTPFDEVYDSAHVRITKGEDVVLTGNTFRIGRDDGGVGVWSPDYGIVIRDCTQCIVRNNVWNRGSIKESVVMLGNNPEVAIDGNIGNPYQPE